MRNLWKVFLSGDYDNFWNVLLAGVITVVFVGVVYLCGCEPAETSPMGERLKACRLLGYELTFNDGTTEFCEGVRYQASDRYIIVYHNYTAQGRLFTNVRSVNPVYKEKK